jgi:hypothetical protein
MKYYGFQIFWVKISVALVQGTGQGAPVDGGKWRKVSFKGRVAQDVSVFHESIPNRHRNPTLSFLVFGFNVHRDIKILFRGYQTYGIY